MTGNPHDAEDVVQQAFLKAYRGLDRFDERSQVGHWLYRIAANCAFDVLRARRRHDSRLESVDEEGSPDLPGPGALLAGPGGRPARGPGDQGGPRGRPGDTRALAFFEEVLRR